MAEEKNPYTEHIAAEKNPYEEHIAGKDDGEAKTWGDYGSLLTMRSLNQAGMGIPNRVVAAKRALLGEDPSYNVALERLNRSQQKFRETNPWATGFGTAGASVGAMMGAGALGLPTLFRYAATPLQRIAAGAAEGGIYGGLHGAGTTYSGIPAEVLNNAGMGATFGMGVGGLAPAAGAAAGATYRWLADQGVLGRFGGGSQPRILVDAATADMAPSSTSPGVRALPGIPGSMLPDAGPSMLGMAQGTTPGTVGPGKSMLIDALRERDRGTGQRIVSDIERTVGPEPPPPSHVDAAIKGRMQELGPAYDAVLANARAVDNSALAAHLDTQIINTKGETQAALQKVRAMLDIPTNPGNLDPHPGAMQATRTEVRNMLSKDDVGDDTRRVLTDAYLRLTRELQAKVPGIRELDSQYAELGTQQRAAATDSAGAQIFDTGRGKVLRPVEAQQVMTEGVQPKGVNVGPSAEAFRLREATRSELYRIVGTNKNDLAKLENVLGQPQDWNQQKLAIMFGQDRADRIMEILARERNFRETFQRIDQGTQTANRQASVAAHEAGLPKIPTDLTVLGLLRAPQKLYEYARSGAIDRRRDSIARTLAESRDPVRMQELVDELQAAQATRDRRQEITRILANRAAIAAGTSTVDDITRKRP